MNDIPIYRNPNPQPPAPLEPTPDNTRKKPSRELLSTLAIIAAAPLIAVILTIFVFQSYEVDGPSMETTLQNKDRLIVNKLSKTWSNIKGSDYTPQRYEIIVFNYAGSTTNSDKRQLIKRVVGLPGDRVVIKNGIVTIFNNQHPAGFQPDKEGPENGTITTTEGNLDETIQEGEVFVLGDNRENSHDSRAIGPIETDEIVGELTLRIYPLDNVKRF